MARLLFTVNEVSWRERHGGFFVDRGTEYREQDGKLVAQEFLSRSFHCVCGEPLRNGDRVLPYDPAHPQVAIHVNCRDYNSTKED